MTPNFSAIRAHYEKSGGAIDAAGASSWGVDPYAWDHEAGIVMTPIEMSLWSDIRRAGAVMYPQFPVGQFFVDFGNPCAKVAIECDGAMWHTDTERDARRQKKIEALGWVVYRFTGRECFSDDTETEDEYGRVVREVGYAYKAMSEIVNRHQIRFGTGEPT